MQYVKGEAELVCEAIPATDLLHTAMKEFFYDLSMKPSETFQQFQAWFFHAGQKLAEQDVKMPEKVMGFMLLKKLRLESTHEAMLLTATKGSMDLKEITAALKSIFPEGKGAPSNRNKDVFMAAQNVVDLATEEPGDYDEVQDAMEAIAENLQSMEGMDDEEILDAYESYAEIRKKIVEKKKARGFSSVEAPRWKLTGTVNGKLEQLKQKTRCHHCQRFGHWRKECPLLARGAPKRSRASVTLTSNSAASSGGRQSETHLTEALDDVYVADDDEARELLEKFVKRPVTWGPSMENNVRNPSFADAHSTRNRQRLMKGLRKEDESGITVATSMTSPVPRKQILDRDHGLDDDLRRQEVLNAEGIVDEEGSFDEVLAQCGVPDVACRRTLVGAYVLRHIADRLAAQGLSVRKAKCRNSFRFGNDGILVIEEVAMFPARIGKKVMCIQAAVLGGHGSRTPLLLSKELLRRLGAVLDMQRDRCSFEALNEVVKMEVTARGHYGIPRFKSVCQSGSCKPEELSEECLEVGTNEGNGKSYDIDALEGEQQRQNGGAALDQERVDRPLSSPVATAVDNGAQGDSSCRGEPRDEGRGCPLPKHHGRGSSWRDEGPGQLRRPAHRPSGSGRRWTPNDERGQVQVQDDAGRSVRDGQVLHHVGAQPWQEREHVRWSAQAADLCGTPGHQEVQLSGERGRKGQGHERNDPYVGENDFFGEPHRDKSHVRENAITGRPEAPQQDPPGQSSPGSNGVRQGRHWMASCAGCRHGHRTLGPDGSETAGPAVPEDEDRGTSGSAGHDEDQLPNDGCDGMAVKTNRKTRRRLRRAVLTLKEGPIQTAELWKPEDREPAELYHVCMSQMEAASCDIAEAFSMPRVVPAATAKGMTGLRSYDIGQGWDFLKAEHRKQCAEEIKANKPRMLIVCPPGGPFSSWQRINSRKGKPSQKKLTSARVLLHLVSSCVGCSTSREIISSLNTLSERVVGKMPTCKPRSCVMLRMSYVTSACLDCVILKLQALQENYQIENQLQAREQAHVMQVRWEP